MSEPSLTPISPHSFLDSSAKQGVHLIPFSCLIRSLSCRVTAATWSTLPTFSHPYSFLDSSVKQGVHLIPFSFLCSQPVLSRDGRHIVYTAWSDLPRRLGIIFCHQRPAALYALDIGDTVQALLNRVGTRTIPQSPQQNHKLIPDASSCVSPSIPRPIHLHNH